jgi:hypothetical protein
VGNIAREYPLALFGDRLVAAASSRRSCHLQRHRDTCGGRCTVSRFRTSLESHHCRGRHELELRVGDRQCPSPLSGTNLGAHARRLESIRSTRNAKLGRKASPYAYRVLDIYLGLRKGTSGCIAPPRAPVRLSVFPSGKDGPLKPRRTVTP